MIPFNPRYDLRFLRAVRTLGLSEAHVLGHILFLFYFADSNCSEYLGTWDEVERTAQWNGAPGLFVEAMLAEAVPNRLGFIVRSSDGVGFCIHNYWTTAPRPVKLRAYKRMRRRLGLGDPCGWTSIRHRILIRDGNVCRYCGSFADTVDHVYPRALGGGNEDSNLVSACRSCNSKKHTRSLDECGFSLRGVN